MTKFRSLMYREMRICRKGNILRALILILFIGMMWAMLRFAPVENMEKIETEMNSFVTNNVIIFTAIIGSMIGLSQDEIFKSDLNSGWMRYSYALSITPFDRALVRIVRLSIMTLAGMIIATLNIIGFCAFTDSPFRIGYIVIEVIALDFMLITFIINEFFVLAARSIAEMKKLVERAGLISFVMMILCVLIFFKKSGYSLKDFSADSFEKQFTERFDIFGKLTGSMLLWLIPLMFALIAVHFAVIYYRFRFAYGAASSAKKETAQNVQQRSTISNTHNEPVGFIYKEIKQNRFGIISVIVLPLCLILFLGLVVAASFIFNEKPFDAPYFEFVTSNIMTLVAIALGYFIASGLLTSIFQGDDKKLWAYFTVSTPTGVRGFMYYKYVLCFAMNGLYMVASIFTNNLVATIRYAVTGKEAESFGGVVLMIFFTLLFTSAVDIPFIIRFGAKKGNMIKLWVMMSLVTIAVVGFSLLPESISDKIMEVLTKLYNGEANNALMQFVSFCPLIVIASYILSYKVSCRLFMKGVDTYDK